MNWKLVSLNRVSNPSRLVFTCEVDEDYTLRLLVHLDGNTVKNEFITNVDLYLDRFGDTQPVDYVNFLCEEKFAICVSRAKAWASTSIGDLLRLGRLFS